MKLRFTIVCETEISNLEHYEAKNLEEAVVNQQKIIDEGLNHPLEIMEFSDEIVSCKVEGIE